jgi:hypothetical protein
MKNLPGILLFVLCLGLAADGSSADVPEPTGPPVREAIEPLLGDGPRIEAEFSAVRLCQTDIIFNHTDQGISFNAAGNDRTPQTRVTVYGQGGAVLARYRPTDDDGSRWLRASFAAGDVIKVDVELPGGSGWVGCASKTYILGR